MPTVFKDRVAQEWLKLYKAALKGELDSTAKEIVLKIQRMKEINDELKCIIAENDKVLNPTRRSELRNAADWLKAI